MSRSTLGMNAVGASRAGPTLGMRTVGASWSAPRADGADAGAT
ncbi:hypothetical protein ACTMSW_15225 [Micromonospora sp. BQ11]